VAAEGVGKELELATARGAVEIVLNYVGGPLGVEELFEFAGAFTQSEITGLRQSEETERELQVISRLFEAFAFQELFAVRASRHLTSVALKARFGSHVEGAGVTLPDRSYEARDGNVHGLDAAEAAGVWLALYNSERYCGSFFE
jgi:hypothetical protein